VGAAWTNGSVSLRSRRTKVNDSGSTKFRRLPHGRGSEGRRKLAAMVLQPRHADCQSAIRQTASLRYPVDLSGGFIRVTDLMGRLNDRVNYLGWLLVSSVKRGKTNNQWEGATPLGLVLFGSGPG
jgi:hypothetical protein